MKINSSDNTDPRWQKKPVANFVRHVQSGNHYARICVRGKLIWKSLKTDRISVAKLRLGDFHKEERQRAAAQTAVARGKMTFADALQTYRERLKGDHSIRQQRRQLRGVPFKVGPASFWFTLKLFSLHHSRLTLLG
jgi:hypothetical protein